eukprot:scaffold781_cov394-Prasinococcus_capsulatus_cf.AAC.6
MYLGRTTAAPRPPTPAPEPPSLMPTSEAPPGAARSAPPLLPQPEAGLARPHVGRRQPLLRLMHSSGHRRHPR